MAAVRKTLTMARELQSATVSISFGGRIFRILFSKFFCGQRYRIFEPLSLEEGSVWGRQYREKDVNTADDAAVFIFNSFDLGT
jgi:hypothetical protein